MTTKNNALSFEIGEAVVYPAHGVGVITGIEEQEVAGFKLELFVITFDKDRLTLRVPLTKAKSSGLRKLSEPAVVKQALDILSGKAMAKRGMWNRRSNDFQERIGTGQLTVIAEVFAGSQPWLRAAGGFLQRAADLRRRSGLHDQGGGSVQPADPDRSSQVD